MSRPMVKINDEDDDDEEEEDDDEKDKDEDEEEGWSSRAERPPLLILVMGFPAANSLSLTYRTRAEHRACLHLFVKTRVR